MTADVVRLDGVTLPSTTASRLRLVGLDNLRGLAILLMIADHLLEVGHGPLAIRESVTRVSMPLFFVISGSLFRRLTWRHLYIALIGFALPLLVPWIDNPNVLLYYAAGCVMLVVARWCAPTLGPWLLILSALTIAANHYNTPVGNSYDLDALVALMAAGALIGRTQLAAIGDRLPAWLAKCGRYPVTTYVVHLLLLEYLLTR